jgi:hypothetical protein
MEAMRAGKLEMNPQAFEVLEKCLAALPKRLARGIPNGERGNWGADVRNVDKGLRDALGVSYQRLKPVMKDLALIPR